MLRVEFENYAPQQGCGPDLHALLVLAHRCKA
jgi:hypothetical protein